MNAFAPRVARIRVALAPIGILLAIACSRDGKETPPAAPSASEPTRAPSATSATAPPAANDASVHAAGERAALPARNDAFSLEPAMLNLGLLEPNEEKRVDFFVKNLTAQPLKITMIKTGCKCVTLDYQKTPIPVGGSAPVHVKVVGVTRESRRVAVMVTTDDPRRSTGELAVFYAVVPPLDFMPPKGDFGKVKQGEKAELAIKVKLHLPNEIEKVPEFEPFLAPDEPIKIALDPPTVTPDGVEFRDVVTTIHLLLDTSRPLAPFQSELVFKPKEPKSFRLTKFSVFGEVRAGTFFEHDKLVLVGGEVGKPFSKSIRLYFTGEKPPELAAVEIVPPEFTEKHELEADKHCIRFDVTCTPSKAGALDGTLNVKLAGGAETLTVALTARSR